MYALDYSILDFPNDPSELDWEKEAILFYYYMLDMEEKYNKDIQKLFKEFKKKLDNTQDINKRKSLYRELKIEIQNIKSKDSDFTRALSFIILSSKVVDVLEDSLEYTYNAILHAESGLNLFPESTEYFDNEISSLEIQEEKSFNKAVNDLIRIVRTESWRYVNELRLEQFKKLGYKFKTTYPVKDDRTADDSWFYYDEHQVKPIDEPFNYTWEGKERVFMTPPDRPNDRNILIPYIP